MTENSIHIRTADLIDIPLLFRLIRESFRDVAERFGLTAENCPKHPSNCMDAWVENDLKRGVVYFILEKGHVAAGCVALEKASPDVCYLERLAVLPRYRNNGFGLALVDHVLSEARRMGVKQVGIGIIAKQAELAAWYEKIGFVAGEIKAFAHLPFMVAFMTFTTS
jgi:predicted N-acetyltransferase YhbS